MKSSMLVLMATALISGFIFIAPADAGITVVRITDANSSFLFQIGDKAKIFHFWLNTKVSVGEKIALSEKLGEIAKEVYSPSVSYIKVKRFPEHVTIRIENAGTRYADGTGSSFMDAVENLQVSP